MNGPDLTGTDRGALTSTLTTTEPSRRSVLLNRLLAVLVAVAAVAGLVYGYLADPLGWFDTGSEVAAVGSAAIDPAAPSTDGGATAEDVLDAAPIEAVDDEPAAGGEADPAGSSADDDIADTANDAALPVGATTAFTDLATTRILDTRRPPEGAADDAVGNPVDPGAVVTVELPESVPSAAATVVLSVNVAQAQGPGAISVDAGAESVTAIEVARAGQMTTNLVFVPLVDGTPLTVATVGGGHLVVDVVGYFSPSGAATAGRFVPVATQRVARLVTEVDGREAVVSPLANPALPASGVAAVMVRITADVGSEGGMVRLGEDLDTLPNTMMWAATSGDDRTRQGVAIVSLSELDELAFTYNGGSVLDLDVLGYFTDDSALAAETGLFQARAASQAVSVDVVAGEPTTVDVASVLGVPAGSISAVAVGAVAVADLPGELRIAGPDQGAPTSATVELGAGRRFGVTATEVGSDGTIVLTSDVDTTVTLTLPGYFLG